MNMWDGLSPRNLLPRHAKTVEQRIITAIKEYVVRYNRSPNLIVIRSFMGPQVQGVNSQVLVCPVFGEIAIGNEAATEILEKWGDPNLLPWGQKLSFDGIRVVHLR